MSRQINQPINQVRLTNVATVRMNKGGKRFEIACYRNKVVNYRQGIETDLSEVLQTQRVFTNVSKGEFAKSKDLETIFGTTDEEDVIKLILEKGDLQISDLERSQQYESMNREIATWISGHCVHPVTQRPYTVPQIRQAMKQAEYAVHPTRSMKKQYLDCFKQIQEKSSIKIVRAKMQLQLVYPGKEQSEVTSAFVENEIEPGETMQQGDNTVVLLLVDPSYYRVLEDLSKKVDGRLEILKQVVMKEGDSNLEQEVRENQQSREQAQNQQRQVAEDQGDTLISFTNKLHVSDPASRKTENGELEEDENEDEDDVVVSEANLRKQQKKAQKMSKKAKRREKEQVEERQARIEAEEKRRQDRAATRPGYHEEAISGAATTAGDGSDTLKSCNTCGGAFASMADYRAHFRSDWHRYNIKLKMKGVSPVSEKEFLLCDADAFFEAT